MIDGQAALELIDLGAADIALALGPVGPAAAALPEGGKLHDVVAKSLECLAILQHEHLHGRILDNVENVALVQFDEALSCNTVALMQWRLRAGKREWQLINLHPVHKTLTYSVHSHVPYVAETTLRNFQLLVPCIGARVVKSPYFRVPISGVACELRRMWMTLARNLDATMTADSSCFLCDAFVSPALGDLVTCALCGYSFHGHCSAEVA